jgi:YidC/Oxa1 family membrane protein insertase
MNKEQTQKRILIATVLSFAFFIAYDFFYIQPQQAAELANTQTQQVLEKKVTSNISPNNNAPQISQSNAPISNISTNKAPISSDNLNTNIISTIKTNKSTIEIDNLGRIAQVTLMQKQYVDEDKKHIKLFNATQLKQQGYDAAKLYRCGFNACELKAPTSIIIISESLKISIFDN